MRAVIYTRVSSDPMQTSRSVDEQEVECRALCVRNGWTVVAVFSDNDRSASRHARSARPQYEALKGFLVAAGADVLVMWEGSRAQRDLDAFVKLRDLCAKHGVQYSYSGRLYDLSRTDDRFTTGLDALLAEREADITRDRVLRASRANAAAGRPHGKLLYGYRREYDERGRYVRQVVNEDQATSVREAARRVLDGESTYAIALSFNERGIPAPRGGNWDLTQIRRLVTIPAYAGHRVHQGKVVGRADWPAILDDATHGACVARLSDPRRRTNRDTKLRYLLTGIARCGVCGGPLKGFVNRGYDSYTCWGSRGRPIDGKRFCTSIAVYKLDNYVQGMLVDRMSGPDAASAFTRAAETDAAVSARAEAAVLRARLEDLYDGAANGSVSASGVAAIEARLLPQIEAADNRSRVASVPPTVRELATPNAAVVWARMDIAARREAVDVLMAVRLLPVGRGRRTFDPNRVDVAWR